MGCPVTTVVVVSVTVVEVIVEVMVVISPSIDKEERNGNEWGDQWDTFGYIDIYIYICIHIYICHEYTYIYIYHEYIYVMMMMILSSTTKEMKWNQENIGKFLHRNGNDF
jgi:hypothetical protein